MMGEGVASRRHFGVNAKGVKPVILLPALRLDVVSLSTGLICNAAIFGGEGKYD